MGVDLRKQFWVIAYFHYYPEGGLEDVEATFDDYDSAEVDAATRKTNGYDHVEIFDSAAREVCKVL